MSDATYTQRRNPAFDAQMTSRTAAVEAAFFLPHLRPGMRLLDVGCGPGSITLGLAEAVAPGEVVGVDLRPEPLQGARAEAARRGISNVRFELGSAYELPFEDGSFDAAFAHVVLMHLRDPVAALAEMRRVLKPGGLAGLREPDFGASLVYPPLTPAREQWADVVRRVWEHNGADPLRARSLRRLLLDAGFARAEAGASLMTAGSLAETRSRAGFLKAQIEGIAQTALAQGWIDDATVEAVVREIDAWAERPDAFSLIAFCQALGWVGD